MISEAGTKIVRASRKCPFGDGDVDDRSPKYAMPARPSEVIAAGNDAWVEDAGAGPYA